MDSDVKDELETKVPTDVVETEVPSEEPASEAPAESADVDGEVSQGEEPEAAA